MRSFDFGGFTAAMIGGVIGFLWLALPDLVAQNLRERLGSRPYPQIIEDAERHNRDALSTIGKPVILIDIPADQAVPPLEQAILAAARKIEPHDGWNITPGDRVKVDFLPHAIRASAPLNIAHEHWGMTQLHVQFDAVPSLRGDRITFEVALTDADVDKLTLLGLHMPWILSSRFEAAILRSLDALNTQLPSPHIPIEIPERLKQAAGSATALLVTPASIAVLLGRVADQPAQTADGYGEAFTRQARAVLPGYIAGAGLIAVSADAFPPSNSGDVLKHESNAANLSSFEHLLGISPQLPPSSLTEAHYARSIMLSLSTPWFTRQLHRLTLEAVRRLETDDVKLTIEAEDLLITINEGIGELAVKGTATFLKGKLTIEFYAVIWSAIVPHPDGMVARYTVRRLDIRRLMVNWNGHGIALAVPHQQALGSLVLSLSDEIKSISETLIRIPALPLDFETGKSVDTRLVLSNPQQNVALVGRATLLSAERINVIAVPVVGRPAESVLRPSPEPDQFQRLEQLFRQGRDLLGGVETRQRDAALLVAKPALARLIEDAWTALDPHIEVSANKTEKEDPIDIRPLPSDASCSSPCDKLGKCDEVLSCKIDVCGDVVKEHCYTWCPGGRWNPICKAVCKKVTETVCHKDNDQNCLDRIAACTTQATICAASWTPVIRLSCETALAAIKAAELNDFATINIETKMQYSGRTFSKAALHIAPNLNSVGLTVSGLARGTVDANIDVMFKDFGHILACPSGRLSATVAAESNIANKSVNAGLVWSHQEQGLQLAVSIEPIVVPIQSKPTPLTALVASNPALLTCTLGRVVVGLGLTLFPRVTQQILADGLRQIVKKKQDEEKESVHLIAAVIDGLYPLKIKIEPFSMLIPETFIEIPGEKLKLRPRLASNAIIIETAP